MNCFTEDEDCNVLSFKLLTLVLTFANWFRLLASGGNGLGVLIWLMWFGKVFVPVNATPR